MNKNSETDLIPTCFFIIPVYTRHEKTSSTSLPPPLNTTYMPLIKIYEYLKWFMDEAQ